MELSRRQRVALVFIGALLAVTAPIVAETLSSNFAVGQNQPIKGQTDNGLTVELTKNYELEGPQPFTDESLNVSSKSNGWINVSSTGSGSITVDEINGTWTNVSNVDVQAGNNITLQPSDKNFTKVDDNVDDLRFKDIKVNDGKTDLRYTASGGEATIVVETNASEGTAYGLVDPDSLEGLDVAVADADGTVDFTEVPTRSSFQDVRIEELGTLTIREESSPHNKITGCSLTVKFFEDVEDDPTIKERTDDDNDGELDLTGLPIDEQFSATAECAGYHNRTVVLNDLSQQETMFLLDKTVSSLENRFTVEDRTGNFPAEETEIIIQKAINRSEYGGEPAGFSWTSVAGDDLGADEAFTVDLEEDARYRVKVQNEGGDSRILGAYRPTSAGDINLVIGSVVLDPDDDAGLPEWSGNYTNETDPSQVNFEYNDSQSNTTTIWLEIFEFNNESNKLLSNSSFTNGPYGTFSNTQNVPSDEEDTTWVIRFTAERTGAETIQQEIVVGPQQPLLPALPTYLVSILFVGTMWIVAGLFSQLNGHIGALVVAGMGAIFFYVDLVPPELGSSVMILSLITAGIIFANEARSGGL